jgi:hypothetical protein
MSFSKNPQIRFPDEGAPRSFPFPWQFRRENYTELYLLSDVREGAVQADILQLLKNYRVDPVPVDAGGRRARGVLMGVAKKAGMNIGTLAGVKTGGAITKGFADIEATLAPSGRALYIEVKAPAYYSTSMRLLRGAGAPSDEQLEFLLEKYKRGAVVMVAWSAAEVLVFLRPLLLENRRSLQ